MIEPDPIEYKSVVLILIQYVCSCALLTLQKGVLFVKNSVHYDNILEWVKTDFPVPEVPYRAVDTVGEKVRRSGPPTFLLLESHFINLSKGF